MTPPTASAETSLAVLYQLSHAMLEAQDDAGVLDLVASAPISVLQANRACVITFTQDGEVASFIHRGPGAKWVQRVDRTELAAGLTGWVVREGRMAVSPEEYDDPRESDHVRERRRQTRCGHIVVLPLQHRAQIMGTLTVITEPGAPCFTPEQLEWLQALANLCAVTLQQRHLHQQLSHLAHFDSLTGLPNRALLEDRLNQALARAVRTRKLCAVLYLDLDGFKAVNDQYGHEVGDQVLCAVAERLQQSMRATDTVARLGGDEFVVVLSDLHSVQSAVSVAEKLRAALGLPLTVAGRSIRLGASIGVSVAMTHAQTADALCRLADQAMYRAKQHGKNLVWTAQADGSVPDSRRLQLEQDIPEALECGEFQVHYQPQFGPGAELVGFEALARWTSPKWGVVAPAEFIPICEESGLIVQLGNWVLHQATAQLSAWQAEGLSGVLMAVNVSPVQFLRPDFEETVRAALHRAGLGAQMLELELTENFVATHLSVVTPRLHALREMGLRIALDDFGAGASVLSQLVDLPLDTLKIDRTFLRDDGVVHKTRRVMGAIAAFARALDLDVVLEGVETQDHLQVARQLACERTQGFLQGRPASVQALQDRLGLGGKLS